MEKKLAFSPTAGPVVLEMHGNARVKGGDEAEIFASSEKAKELILEARPDGAYLRCDEDCTVRMPRQAQIQAVVHGNGSFKALEGDLKIEVVHGNLELRSVGNTEIEVVHGNLEAKNILGALKIEKVDGNVSVRDLQGAFEVEKINGNLKLEDADGGATAEVEGNVMLRLDPTPSAHYDIQAKGNIACKLSEDASVHIRVSEAAQIMVNLPGSKSKPYTAPFEVTLGDGDADVSLAAEGNILLASQAPTWDAMPGPDYEFSAEFDEMAATISQQVTQQMQAQIEMLEQQLNSQLGHLGAVTSTAGLPVEEAVRVRQRAQEASQRAMERAQEKMRRAQERMERKMATLQQRAERRSDETRNRRHGFRFQFPGEPPAPPAPPVDPVSDEERMLILKMLEQKQITLEQAEQLLSALEGNN